MKKKQEVRNKQRCFGCGTIKARPMRRSGRRRWWFLLPHVNKKKDSSAPDDFDFGIIGWRRAQFPEQTKGYEVYCPECFKPLNQLENVIYEIMTEQAEQTGAKGCAGCGTFRSQVMEHYRGEVYWFMPPDSKRRRIVFTFPEPYFPFYFQELGQRILCTNCYKPTSKDPLESIYE